MRTPAGKECVYFYGNYYRGRSQEECRLLGPEWRPALCETCPVPEIILANACKHQELRGKVVRPFKLLKPRVEIEAYCTKCACEVKEPRVGCGQCHNLSFIISGEEK